MNLLLDTQILVWLVNGDRRLRSEWIAQIKSADTDLIVSAVIAFEYCELVACKRLPVDEPFAELAARFDLEVAALPEDAWLQVATLPAIHRDPVDRMLIAHALTSGMTIITADAKIRRYPVPVL